MLELLGTQAVVKGNVGPMFSGKTDTLIGELNAMQYSRIFPFQAFKPLIDKRFGVDTIKSRSGLKVSCTPLEESRYLLKHLKRDTRVVGLDEVQFFDPEILDVVMYLKEERGISVIWAGLDLDFRGEPYNSVPALMAYSHAVPKFKNYCTHHDDGGIPGTPGTCQLLGTRTQRYLHGEPAPYDDPREYVEEDIGSPERTYALVCELHHRVPGKPENKMIAYVRSLGLEEQLRSAPPLILPANGYKNGRALVER